MFRGRGKGRGLVFRRFFGCLFCGFVGLVEVRCCCLFFAVVVVDCSYHLLLLFLFSLILDVV